ncbi:MAG: hypothetical protein R6U40_06320 [Desulfobacterales bacterium]
MAEYQSAISHTDPSSFDLRDINGHSYIGPVRDLGDCGSCYSSALWPEQRVFIIGIMTFMTIQQSTFPSLLSSGVLRLSRRVNNMASNIPYPLNSPCLQSLTP